MFKIVTEYKPGELEYQIQAQQRGYQTYYVGDEEQYWSKDIDFILDGKIKVEVKWDSKINSTGNLFIEMKNPRSQDGLGWYKFIQADLLAYGDSKTENFYIIHLEDLRQYIQDHEQELKYKSTDDGSEGYLLPLENINHYTF